MRFFKHAHLVDESLSHAAKAFVDLVMTIPHLFRPFPKQTATLMSRDLLQWK